MQHHTELSFVDEFRWVSPLHYLKNGWQRTLFFFGACCKRGPSFLHYYCAVALHSCSVLPSVGHSSNHEYYCCQLTRKWSRVTNFYRTFKVFIWLSLVHVKNTCTTERVPITATVTSFRNKGDVKRKDQILNKWNFVCFQSVSDFANECLWSHTEHKFDT